MPEAAVSCRIKPQSGESLYKTLMKLGIVRASCPIAGDYDHIIAGLYPGLFQTICFAYAAAYPVADDCTSELHADRNSETVVPQTVFADIDCQKRIHRRFSFGIRPSEITIFFDRYCKTHSLRLYIRAKSPLYRRAFYTYIRPNCLVSELSSALRTSAGQNLSAVGGSHSLTEAMLAGALTLLGLISTDHSD